MAKRILLLTLAVALMGIAGWALAQPSQPQQKKPEGIRTGRSGNAVTAPAPQPEQKKAEGRPGLFAVAASGETAVLLDTAGGKTWVLRQAGNGGAVWLPVHRLDSEKEAREWLERERAQKAALQDQERARRAALEGRERARQEEAVKEAQRRLPEMLRAIRGQRESVQKGLKEFERRLRTALEERGRAQEVMEEAERRLRRARELREGMQKALEHADRQVLELEQALKSRGH